MLRSIAGLARSFVSVHRDKICELSIREVARWPRQIENLAGTYHASLRRREAGQRQPARKDALQHQTFDSRGEAALKFFTRRSGGRVRIAERAPNCESV